MPPGGPPDTEAPKLLAVTPDSGRTLVKVNAAVFEFDEVVSERPPGVTTLGDLFVVSPRQGAPNVAWHRSSITVKPRKGWLPNTTYTVTMLPGLSDLRGNVKNTGVSTFFSTGTTIDRGTLTGSVADLAAGTVASGAVIEARSGRDTTVSWMGRTDSSGAFRLAHLPPRTFLIRAYVDKNKNFAADPDEPVDTATVTVSDSASADFFVAARDSVAPKLASAVVSDSVTITAAFDRPANSASAVTAANYTLIGQDSSLVPIVAVKPAPRDSALKRFRATRALPVSAVVITIGRPLSEKAQYRLRAVGIHGLVGQTMPSETPLRRAAAGEPAVKRPPPPPNLPGGAVPIPIKHD
jgi:hypothetical protein